MASSAPPSSSAAGDVQNPISGRKPLGSLKAAIKKNKHGLAQVFAMTAVLMLSCRSLTQKYRINDLILDTEALKEEQQSLVSKMNRIKQSLLAEAEIEPTGAFTAKLRVLFGDGSS